MFSLQEMFVLNGWDPSWLAYGGAAFSFLVMLVIYIVISRDDSLD